MTPTASYDPVQTAQAPSKKPAGKFKTIFTVFKWELRNCKSPLTVFAIIASVLLVVIFTLCMLGMFSTSDIEELLSFEKAQSAVLLFQVIASFAVFYLNAIFTIIYTIRIYSYLHNKRKADMYGALPIGRRTFYIAKTISAFLFSVIPTMFFFGLISIISLLFGQPVLNEVGKLYLQLLFGSVACISFYGLLSVCCGNSLNAVLSFVAINIAYPLAALFIKGVLKSFLYGIPAGRYNSSFIMRALNPLSAYDGTHLIYWTVFIAACLFLGIFLIKKRKAECAQTSFAYYLPCYAVKLLIAFCAGMFLGITFASISAHVNGYLLFCFGFMTASIPAYIITHLILYKGFNKLMKTAIPLGGLILTVVISMAFLHFDPFGYVSHVPTLDEVESAGVIDLSDCYQSGRESSASLASQAADDFTDKGTVGTIIDFHKDIVDKTEKANTKYQRVWLNIIYTSLPSEYLNSGYCVSYKLKNGSVLSRVYDDGLGSYNVYDSDIDKIVDSDVYFINYNAVMNIKPDEITSFELTIPEDHDYYDGENFDVSKNSKVSEAQANADRMKIIEAYRADVREHGTADSVDSVCRFTVKYTGLSEGGYSLTEIFMSSLIGNGQKTVYVSKDYSRTIEALRETGMLIGNNYGNNQSPYHTTKRYYIYD